MNSVVRIVSGSPWWVFPLLGLLIWLGLQAARSRVVDLRRVFMTPAIFIIWGLVSLAARQKFSALMATDWLVAAVCGGALAILTTRIDGMRADRRNGRVHLPGSWLPLVRILSIFAAKYGLAVTAAIRPDRRESLALWDIAVSGAGAGYFLGWVVAFIRSYRQAPVADLIAENRPVAEGKTSAV